MAKEADSPFETDGSVDFSAGVDSLKVPTVASPVNPNGLTRQQLSWLINGTVRTGGIEPRDGWVYRGVAVGALGLPSLLGKMFQGKVTYVPSTGNPYEIWVVGGHVLKVDPTFQNAPVDLSEVFALLFPASGSTTKAYFCQAGPYLVIQCGDFNAYTGLGALPFFWNGTTLWQSNGLTGITSNWLEPAQYGFVPASPGFIVPAVGSSVTFNVPTQYGGLILATMNLFAQAANIQELLGTFQVTASTLSTMTLKTISLSGSARGRAGAQIITACVLESTPGPPGNTIGYAVNVSGYLFGTAESVTIPAVGASQTITLAGDGGIPATGYYIIYGTTNNPIGAGNVTASSEFSMTITWTATATAASIQGQTLGALPYNGTGTPSNGNSFTIPVIGTWAGNIGDTVYLSGTTFVSPNVVKGYQFGTFEVTGFGSGNITLKALYVPTPGQIVLYDGYVTPPIGNPYFISSNQYQTTGSGLISQIPAATAMAYYEGQIWYMTGQTVSGGDIVAGPSGTLANNYLDSVLSVTENELSFGGSGFTMPAGNDLLTGLAIPQMINASLGQGLLNIGSANWVFSLYVPVSRAAWIAANSNNQPQINVVQSGTGTGFANDWTVCPINGDLWYTSFAGDERSLLTAVRYFQQYANPALSSDEDRILSAANTSLLNWTSSAFFDNRRLSLTMPFQGAYGVYFNAVVPLDLTTISTLEQQDQPNWEGAHERLQILKLDIATFGNQQRLFAAVLSPTIPGQMEVWENVPGQIGDQSATQNNRILWQATLASYTWGKEFQLKELQGGELWLDKIIGTADIEIEYCPDGSSCWYKWCALSVCSAGDSSQLAIPAAYPLTTFQPGVRKPLQLPHPPEACSGENNRPGYHAYEFQPRITIRGQCRIRGFRMFASERKVSMYEYLARGVSRWPKSIFQSILGG